MWTTLNKDQNEKKRQLLEEVKKKITETDIKDKDHFVTGIANIITYKVHGTVNNLQRHTKKRKEKKKVQADQQDNVNGQQRARKTSQNIQTELKLWYFSLWSHHLLFNKLQFLTDEKKNPQTLRRFTFALCSQKIFLFQRKDLHDYCKTWREFSYVSGLLCCVWHGGLTLCRAKLILNTIKASWSEYCLVSGTSAPVAGHRSSSRTIRNNQKPKRKTENKDCS